MHQANVITSVKNPLVKQVLTLQKSSERKKQNLFIIEGKKEIEKALKAQYSINKVIICPEIYSANAEFNFQKNQIVLVSKSVFTKLAYRENNLGVLVIATPKVHHLQQLVLPKKHLVLVLESVEKPGNIGAILRTADAAGIDAIFIVNPKTDIYNPNIIRASLGCVFSLPIVVSTSQETINYLASLNTKIYATYLEASVPYTQVDFTSNCALVMGAEDQGISQNWVKNATQNIIIPMYGEADSLNVSTAAAIILFEAIRQRS